MHPSIKFDLVKNAANFYTKNVSKSEKFTTKHFLNLIKFSMTNTLMYF